MEKSELDILSSAFSAQRLSKYLAYNKGDAERTVTHYKANMRLAESLYISLSVFEVTLRNALSRELRNLAGKDDWWDLFYVTCLHDNLRTVLGWMNADMPDWLAKIDPFDKVSADIRKEMGWR